MVDVIPLFLQNVVVTDGSEKVPSSLSAEEIMSRSVLITETILFVRKERKKERKSEEKKMELNVFFFDCLKYEVNLRVTMVYEIIVFRLILI